MDNLEVFVSNGLEQSMKFYLGGIKNRKTAQTEYNLESSRSHSIFIIKTDKGENKLSFIDLAGSEKIRDDSFIYDNPKQFQEAGNINRSLLCLGKVVNSLSNKNSTHISYRDSKLTFLLKDSLDGDCKLCIIGNINPCNSSDSINTLKFIQRVKMIQNNPKVKNENISKYNITKKKKKNINNIMIKKNKKKIIQIVTKI